MHATDRNEVRVWRVFLRFVLGVVQLNNKREHWVDWVRALGVVAIIILHVTAREKVWRDGNLSRFEWWTLTSYETLTRIAVPLFFMISGHLVIAKYKKDDNSNYHVYRGLRTLGIAVIWTVLFGVWELLRGRIDSLFTFILNTLLGSPYYHLWFLYAIATTYFLTPLIAGSLQGLSPKQCLYWGTLLPCVCSLDFLLSDCQGLSYYRNSFLSIGVPFVSLSASGYLLFRVATYIHVSIPLLVYALGASLCLVSYGYLYGGKLPAPDRTVFSPMSPAIVLMSLSAYLVFIRISTVPPRWIASLANRSLALYLMHPFILDILNRLRLYGREPNAVVGVLWMTALILLGTWLASSIVIRTPMLKRIVRI